MILSIYQVFQDSGKIVATFCPATFVKVATIATLNIPEKVATIATATDKKQRIQQSLFLKQLLSWSASKQVCKIDLEFLKPPSHRNYHIVKLYRQNLVPIYSTTCYNGVTSSVSKVMPMCAWNNQKHVKEALARVTVLIFLKKLDSTDFSVKIFYSFYTFSLF